jgi:hypothetical protein
LVTVFVTEKMKKPQYLSYCGCVVAEAEKITNLELLKDLKMILEYIIINYWNFLFLVY